ncbi:major pollen allergen Lig v 1-like [Humulus lupulus]|uniref:major pollen allergen Lig v 1-like n=1 Tax=Humulus lupulus TaxID=3486 RepID=UPI002B406B60|nr:major pollen allergen Lig v 1-like [Humulus lupulus]
MKSLLLLFVVSSFILIKSFLLEARQVKTSSHIVVMGFVYCDTCHNNTFSKHSYFLPGAEVKVDCIFKAIAPRTAEQISFSVNRTTNKHGLYRLEIPSVEGIKCAAEESAIVNSCQASLMWSSSSSCDVPGYKVTSDQITVKSKGANVCIYSLNALNFRPSKKEPKCGNSK